MEPLLLTVLCLSVLKQDFDKSRLATHYSLCWLGVAKRLLDFLADDAVDDVAFFLHEFTELGA